MKYFLAIDIGASSGRHILSWIQDGRIQLEEIYRFPNGMVQKDGSLVWDTDALWEHILTGMKKCKEVGKIPDSMGIDTWAVDYVLLDEEDQILGKTYGYRDGRTKGMDDAVYEKIPLAELYERTGIQKQIFNTIYQLMANKVREPELLNQAKTMLMIPDYFHFLLTGVKITEYTNASTTQLLDPKTKEWDTELMERLGFPRSIFTKIEKPGTVLGPLQEGIANKVGFSCQVVLPATHDTGSAVLAVPTLSEDALYISSGTWSLMGVELRHADCTKGSMEHNFTNEGGYEYRFRYLKNIMGMWMINSARAELAPEVPFGDICEGAKKESIASVVDANDDRFLAPESMVCEVRKACEESGQQVPQTMTEVAAVIYHSLAECYAKTAREIKELTGKNIDCIHIVGGGCKADYLNELTAKAAGLPVYAGPVEATAIGNLAAQMIAAGEWKDIWEARKCIMESFGVTVTEAK